MGRVFPSFDRSVENRMKYRFRRYGDEHLIPENAIKKTVPTWGSKNQNSAAKRQENP